jgi:hypothetical protein
VPRVDRPSILIDIGLPSTDLLDLLALIVAVLAERLQCTEEELVRVPVVWVDVVNNVGCLRNALG